VKLKLTIYLAYVSFFLFKIWPKFEIKYKQYLLYC